MRINKYIASCGVCSRRKAEEFVLQGKVKVNGKVIANLATDIDETNDTVIVDGQRITPVSRFIYIMMYKPKGCVCTLKDEKGRKTVLDYLGDFEGKRIFPVGFNKLYADTVRHKKSYRNYICSAAKQAKRIVFIF